MKKAGIITFNGADNFGAMLQCYALQRYVEKSGATAIVADGEDKAVKEFYKPIRLTKNIKFIISMLKKLPKNMNRRKRFDDFRKKYLNITKKYDDCDIFICGSDQIWNFDITKGYNPFYFADFKKKSDAIVVSYAASIGKKSICEYEEKIIREKLKGFEMISVREENAKNILSKLTEKEISVLPDPTLLLKKEEWETMMGKKKSPSKYILLYSLCSSPEALLISKRIAHETGFELIEIRGDCAQGKNIDHKVFDYIGPNDFLRFINDAEFVVTDSFHGTVFSVIFEKNFYSIPPKGLGERVKTLLSQLDINSRLITEVEKIDLEEKIDYNKVNNRLEKICIDADKFILQAMERVEK